jgi:hypothetical protein
MVGGTALPGVRSSVARCAVPSVPTITGAQMLPPHNSIECAFSEGCVVLTERRPHSGKLAGSVPGRDRPIPSRRSAGPPRIEFTEMRGESLAFSAGMNPT